MVKLSILIPTLYNREEKFLFRLWEQIESMSGGRLLYVKPNVYTGFFTDDDNYTWEFEVLTESDDGKVSIGSKRNKLLSRASGEYIAFIDDDDRIGEKYFDHAFKGIEKGVDACGLTGIITEDGKNHKKFVHSMKYDHWFEKDGVYYRNNNHLNVVRREIAKKMIFPETSQGEDHDYSKQLLASGLIKTEYWDENEILYYYDWISNK